MLKDKYLSQIEELQSIEAELNKNRIDWKEVEECLE